MKIESKFENWFAILLLIVTIAGCVFSLASCKTQQPQVAEKVVTNTEYVDRIKYDSIYIDNYIYIEKGADTITITKTNIEYRYKILVDSVEVLKVDSIPYEVQVVEYIERMNNHQRTMYWLGWLAVVIVGLRLFWKIYKKFKL